MKATGIVRRIDDLGRVVIPHDIRRAKNIREGDPIEFYVTDEGIVLVKHNDFKSKEETAQKWLQDNVDGFASFSPRFSIEGDIATCECICGRTRKMGTAKRSPGDEYSPAVGMVYAFCRASGMPLPKEW